MAEPVIELSGVTRHFVDGPAALRDVSLTVHAGEAVAILGPSGSGKSTMLNMIAGLDRPDSGTVKVAGVRVDKLNETGAARYRRDNIGMIFQFFNLLDDLTVLDNVVLPAEMTGMARGKARKQATGLLETLGIAQHMRAYPGRLSGGERQRVAVARALMNRPALLLADEPTGALDSASGEEVKGLLRELHADGQTIILVTHDLTLAQTCATRTVGIVDGRIASDTRTDAPAAGARAQMAR
ncbi:ABC transporter ATP-binding protein [Streptomyces canus]|uniref:ABC transporter ATP-binding protein n=1 Tax=Streptomyces canus TaxID=58343 RepID=A0A101RN61_9ACTN|nr:MULTISPECIES: ABC transporter ATP-binding protein [Streptomyces]KUN58463.1 ABC transporter ATP-binding protein [Streptomyces canus]MDI5912170.1 ABC transporter ATP-binding protein [Streptomyces sp. 12257]